MKVQGKRDVVRLLGQKLILESSETMHDGQGLGTIFSSTFLSKLLVSALTFLSKVFHTHYCFPLFLVTSLVKPSYTFVSV